jgi:hypothetical protein
MLKSDHGVVWKEREYPGYVVKIRYRKEGGAVLIEVTSPSEGRSEGVRGSAAALMHHDVMCKSAGFRASVTSVTQRSSIHRKR